MAYASLIAAQRPMATALLMLLLGAGALQLAQAARAHVVVSREVEYLSGGACPIHNPKLAAWIRDQLAAGAPIIPQSTDFDSFVLEVRDGLEKHHLPQRAVHHLFSDQSDFHPTCAGQWMEFGVFNGDTANLAARARSKYCKNRCPPLFGFDTFTGLPEKWERDDSSNFAANTFDRGGRFPPVESNVQLVKGLFSDSLPQFLKEQSKFAGANQTVSYLHIDCDLYAGSRDAFENLSDHIEPGTVIVFDELVNYAKFRDHEIKAFWEWLQASGAKVLPYGILGPLPGKSYAVDLDLQTGEHDWFTQSTVFVVVSKPAAAHH